MRKLATSNLALASLSATVFMIVGVFPGIGYGFLLLSLVNSLSVIAHLRVIRFDTRNARSGGVEMRSKAEHPSTYPLVIHVSILLMSALLSILWIVLAAALIAQGNPRLFGSVETLMPQFLLRRVGFPCLLPAAGSSLMMAACALNKLSSGPNARALRVEPGRVCMQRLVALLDLLRDVQFGTES